MTDYVPPETRVKLNTVLEALNQPATAMKVWGYYEGFDEISVTHDHPNQYKALQMMEALDLIHDLCEIVLGQD